MHATHINPLVKLDFGTQVSRVASGFLKADGSTFGEGPGDGHQGFIYGWNCNLNNKDSTRSRGTLWYKQKFPAKFDLMDDLVIPDRNGRCALGKPLKFMLEVPAGKYVIKISFMDTTAGSISDSAGCHVQGVRVGSQTVKTSCNTREDSACQVFTVEVGQQQHKNRIHIGGSFKTGCKAVNYMEVYPYKPDLAASLITYEPIKSGHRDEAMAQKISPSLKAMLSKVVDPQTNIIAVTSVNAGYIDMASNWLCSMRKLGIKNYILYATDEEAEKYFKKRGENVYRYDARKITGGSLSAGSVKYGSVAYQELILARTKFVNMVLSMGYNTLLCDIDAVWIRNPFEYFDFAHDIEAQQEVDGRLCGGFILLMSTAKTVKLWHKVAEKHEKLVRTAESSHHLANIDESEQTIFINLIPQMGVTVRKMDKNIFPPGLRFFGEQMSFRSRMPPGAHPAVVHNNYVIGHEKKVKRFKHFRLWFVRRRGDDYVCTN